jgi:hypothetical protein
VAEKGGHHNIPIGKIADRCRAPLVLGPIG